MTFFCRNKRNCPLYTGVRIKRVSVERGSTVIRSFSFLECVFYSHDFTESLPG